MLGELDIGILDDLHTIAPWIPELHTPSGQQFHSSVLELLSDLLFIVYDEAKMAASV